MLSPMKPRKKLSTVMGTFVFHHVSHHLLQSLSTAAVLHANELQYTDVMITLLLESVMEAVHIHVYIYTYKQTLMLGNRMCVGIAEQQTVGKQGRDDSIKTVQYITSLHICFHSCKY